MKNHGTDLTKLTPDEGLMHRKGLSSVAEARRYRLLKVIEHLNRQAFDRLLSYLATSYLSEVGEDFSNVPTAQLDQAFKDLGFSDSLVFIDMKSYIKLPTAFRKGKK